MKRNRIRKAALTVLLLAAMVIAPAVQAANGTAPAAAQLEEAAVKSLGETRLIDLGTGKGIRSKGTSSIGFGKKSYTVELGYTYTMGFKVSFSGNWEWPSAVSSNTDVLTCEIQKDSSGFPVLKFKTRKTGTAALTLTCGGKKATTKIKVVYRKPACVMIKPAASRDSYFRKTEGNIYRGMPRTVSGVTTQDLVARVWPEENPSTDSGSYKYCDQAVTWKSGNKKVAKVDSNGRVTAVSPGTCVITAVSKANKKIKATFTLFVVNYTKRRAIILADWSGTNGNNSANFEQSLTANTRLVPKVFERNDVEVVDTIINDAGAKTKFQNAVDKVSRVADADDITFIFISGHGTNARLDSVAQHRISISPNAASNGRNAYLYSSELKEILDEIPGTKVVMLESCHSGSAISKGTGKTAAPANRAQLTAFANGFVDVFRNGSGSGAPNGSLRSKNGELCASDYYVICGAQGDQLTRGVVTKGFTGWYFTQALCKGMGWDLNKDKKVKRAAESVKDGFLTQSEIFNYARTETAALVKKYAPDNTQTVVCWPDAPDNSLIVLDQ
ncbi:MAG: caspase family protein [Clostridia bacterium]|nr:caspase family protein [Clostridia bacterium]